jgi:hypothetical protein
MQRASCIASNGHNEDIKRQWRPAPRRVGQSANPIHLQTQMQICICTPPDGLALQPTTHYPSPRVKKWTTRFLAEARKAASHIHRADRSSEIKVKTRYMHAHLGRVSWLLPWSITTHEKAKAGSHSHFAIYSRIVHQWYVVFSSIS